MSRHAVRCSLLTVLLLLTSACSSIPNGQQLDQYDRVAREGKLEEAEQGYDSYLESTPLEDDQWQAVRARRCEVTGARVRADFEELKSQAGSEQLPDRRALLDLLSRGRACYELSELNREIEAMMIARTEEDVEREIQPLYDAGRFLAMVTLAHEFSPMLPKEHRYAKWFMQVRQLMAKKLDVLKEEALKSGATSTSFYYGMLQDELQGKSTDKKMPPDVRAAFAKRVAEVIFPTIHYQVDQISVDGALGSCAPLFHKQSALPDGPLRYPLAIKVNASANFSRCDVEVLSTTPLPSGGTRVVLQVVAESNVLAGVEGSAGSGEASVNFTESHTFDVPGAVSDPQQALAAVVASRGSASSPYPFDVSFTDLLMKEYFPKMFSHEQVRQGLHQSALDTSDPSHKAERLLAALLSAPDSVPEDYAITIGDILGVAPSSYPDRMLTDPVWLNAYASNKIPRRPWDKEVANARQNAGIPTMMTEIGGAYVLPEQGLVGQPDRSALALDIRSNFRLPLLMPKGRFLNWGFLFGLEGGFLAGKRFGEDYQDVTGPGIAVYEPDEEYQAFGFHLGLSAMMGYRGNRLGLFAGIKPDFLHRGIGFYRNQGVRTPLVGRLEVRMSSSRAILLEGWGWNINVNSTNSSYGGSVWLPLGEGVSGFTSSGIVLRAQQDVLPAVFFGLNQTDDVRLEETTLRSGGVSYFIGF